MTNYCTFRDKRILSTGHFFPVYFFHFDSHSSTFPRFILNFFLAMPTVEEVCSSFGLNDVKIPYEDVDYQHLSTYSSFCAYVRPILAKENPKVN